MMKKIFLSGLICLVLLSACSANKDTEYTDVVPIQIEDTSNDSKLPEESSPDIRQASPTEITSDNPNIEEQLNGLEHLIGEYDYSSDYGIGRLIINKTAYGYDISDYESESSYRFLANSSNIDMIENNRIYIKYPEQVFSDDTVIFSYYILEYGTDGINVYYTKSADEEGQLLYHATRKNEE